jgi:hypothetical protein
VEISVCLRVSEFKKPGISRISKSLTSKKHDNRLVDIYTSGNFSNFRQFTKFANTSASITLPLEKYFIFSFLLDNQEKGVYAVVFKLIQTVLSHIKGKYSWESLFFSFFESKRYQTRTNLV